MNIIREDKNNYVIMAGDVNFTLNRNDGGKFYLHILEKNKMYLVNTLDEGVEAVVGYLLNTHRRHYINGGIVH